MVENSEDAYSDVDAISNQGEVGRNIYMPCLNSRTRPTKYGVEGPDNIGNVFDMKLVNRIWF